MDKTLKFPVIKVRNLSKDYRRLKAIEEVSFEVEKGEVFGLIGPDGAGKTTIIHILASVLEPSSGEAYINGINVVKESEKIKKLIGYMPQGLGLNIYDNLTVEENINFFKDIRLIPEKIFQKNKEILLEITRLKPFLSRPAKALSGGMRQKLALVCTLLHLPEVILLDEPTTGVDPLSRQDFWEIIHALVQEREITVFLTTAYMDEAERCNRIALMHKGKIFLQDKPENIPDLEGAFIEAVSREKPKPFLKKPISKKEANILICNKVSKLFGKFRAVDRVSLEVKRGEIFGLLGPNGAGKTTLIKMMCGLLSPSEGEIFISGHNVEKEKVKVWKLIGYMSQKFSLYKDLTVLENIKLYAGLYGVKNENFRELLEKLGLLGWEGRLVKDIPFGIKQRLALSCAVLHKPVIVFLDEPTSGVDPVARRSFWEMIYFLSRDEGMTIILSTHYMDEAENCDRIGLINRGKLIALGTPEELKITSEKISGKFLQIKTSEFREVFKKLKSVSPNLSLYGNKILLRTFAPEIDKEKIEKFLTKEGISKIEISQTLPSLQEAFIDFIRKDLKENPENHV
uniref:ABC transporter ATP-binding protein n=1 Tax=Thermodesulfobacterium geofontis TaxID=1295609 RepID=A0A7V5XGD6_9BACT